MFHHIDVDGANGVVCTLDLSLFSREAQHAICTALELAESSSLFFRGLYPSKSPYYVSGESIQLPWYDEYWGSTGVGAPLSAMPILTELQAIAGHLRERTPQDASNPKLITTFLSDALCERPMLKMQGLACECLQCVDQFLIQVALGNMMAGFPYIAGAYERIIECTIFASELLGNDPLQSRRLTLVGTQPSLH